jgi:hypothetical protein
VHRRLLAVAMVRRNIYEQLGGSDTRLTNLQDLDFWVRMAVAGFGIHVVDHTVTAFRVRDGQRNMSASRTDTALRGDFEFRQILRHFESIDTQVLMDEPLDPRLSPAAQLAKVAFTTVDAARRSFALQTLYERADGIDDIILLRDLAGTADIHGRMALDEMSHQVDALDARLEEAQKLAEQRPPPEQVCHSDSTTCDATAAELARILASRSWRYTAGFRWLVRTARRLGAKRRTRSKPAPVVICPYLYDNEADEIRTKFRLDKASACGIEFFLWQDKKHIGPEFAFEHCWERFPERDIIIVHSDMAPMAGEPSTQWFDALVSFRDDLSTAGMLACNLYYPGSTAPGSLSRQFGGGTFHEGKIGHLSGVVDEPGGVPSQDLSRVRTVDWVTFGGVLLRRELIKACGAIDRRYKWAYVMDVDYSFEARLRSEWLNQKHGIRSRRRWRKLHLGVDADTHEIVAVELTPDDVGDISGIPDLLDQIDADVASMTADGAYDGEAVYDAVAERHPDAAVMILQR